MKNGTRRNILLHSLAGCGLHSDTDLLEFFSIRGFVDVSGDLRKVLTLNQNLLVLVAAGYYDLTTPYFAQKYTKLLIYRQ